MLLFDISVVNPVVTLTTLAAASTKVDQLIGEILTQQLNLFFFFSFFFYESPYLTGSAAGL